MLKKDLIASMADSATISKVCAEKALNTLLGDITKALKKGKKVTFVGFGTFSVKKRNARKGRNPRTGKEIKIPAARVPKFTPGKALKDAVM
jgi:DNA-binding protein HU-beta